MARGPSGVGASPALAARSTPWATQSSGTINTFVAYPEFVSTLADGSAMVTGQFKGAVVFGSTSLTSRCDSDTFVAKFLGSPQALGALHALVDLEASIGQ